MTLWLVGMMGSGKSTVGRMAAEMTGAAFIDLDTLIEEELGTSIAEFWTAHGESAFRSEEARVLSEVTGDDTIETAIVSTGGGAPLAQKSRELMRATGTVVWLRAKPEEISRRLVGCRSRPLVPEEGDAIASLVGILDARAALYGEVADVSIDTDNMGIEMVAAEVVRAWRM